jgi:hypothetical protein
MPASDLTTLAAVKAWLSITTTGGDTQLSGLVTAASRAIYAYLARPALLPQSWSERYDGHGYMHSRLTLRRWPVTSITSLSVDNQSIPAAATPGAGVAQPAGYLLEPWDGIPPGRPQSLDLFCYSYSRGRQNIAVSYVAGYQVSAEAQAVPATPFRLSTTTTPGLSLPFGPWGSDVGVTYANGTALAKVAGPPAVGQYQVAQVGGDTVYQFAAADVGASVLISYGFIPQDVAQSALELVAERYTYKGRIGELSKTLGGQETVSFSQKSIPDTMKLILQPYRQVIPV